MNRDDIRKIKELNVAAHLKITCHFTDFKAFKYVGKILKGEAENSNRKITVEIGTLNNIDFLFSRLSDFGGVKAKAIIIGKVKLRKDSDNCLPLYGIKDNFKFTYEV